MGWLLLRLMVKIVVKLPLTVNFPVKTKKKVLQPTFFSDLRLNLVNFYA